MSRYDHTIDDEYRTYDIIYRLESNLKACRPALHALLGKDTTNNLLAKIGHLAGYQLTKINVLSTNQPFRTDTAAENTLEKILDGHLFICEP